MWAAEGAAHAEVARRRRERRHRAYLKYVRMSVAMALSEYKHHLKRAEDGQGRGRGYEKHYTATFRSNPPTRRKALSTFPWTSKMCLPQERVLQHTLEARGRHLPRAECRCSSAADGNQLLEVFRLLDTMLPEQFIDVPKISQDRNPAALGGL